MASDSITGKHISQPAVGPSGKWQETIERSYAAWKADFDDYCHEAVAILHADPLKHAEFRRFAIAANAIYHAAHIALNVEILDLQVLAGTRHTLGRPISRSDHDRATTLLKEWARSQGASPATKAASHAARLLRDGALNLTSWDINDRSHYPWCFHYPWFIYLATITCWALRAAIMDTEASPATTLVQTNSDSSLHGGFIQHCKVEATALLNTMVNASPADLSIAIRQYSTFGLTNLVAHHLSSVRWAVIHEAVKVLQALDRFEPRNGRRHYID
jgi:hypothetical protein